MIRCLCVASLILASGRPSVLRAAPVSLALAEPAQDDFARGTQELDQQRWQDAIGSFERVAESKGKKADSALYWKSYALNKLGRATLVSSTCTQLRTEYAGSTWNRDCSTLVIPEPLSTPPMHDASRGAMAGSDADLKALALNSLLNREPARAMPMIRTILTSNNPPEWKHRALGMVAQNHSPDARALLRDVAMGSLAPDLQRQAIQMMGVFQGKHGNNMLAEVYRTSNETSIKRAVISAYFISGDASRMVDLARSEKDLKLKHDIVAQLALMNDKAATDYMTELLR